MKMKRTTNRVLRNLADAREVAEAFKEKNRGKSKLFRSRGVAGGAMHPRGEPGGIEGCHALGQERRRHSGEHVTGAGRGHPRIARLVVGRVADPGHERAGSLEHDHCVDRSRHVGGSSLEKLAFVGLTAPRLVAEEAEHLSGMRREHPGPVVLVKPFGNRRQRPERIGVEHNRHVQLAPQREHEFADSVRPADPGPHRDCVDAAKLQEETIRAPRRERAINTGG